MGQGLIHFAVGRLRAPRQPRRRPQERDRLIEALERRVFLSAIAPTDSLLTDDPGVQQMPSIAVDPADARHLVVAYMDRSLVNTGYAGIGVRVSRDGGASWSDSSLTLPSGFDQGAADPVVRFDASGKQVFVSFMAATFLGSKPPITDPDTHDLGTNGSDRAFGFQSDNGIFVATSNDGGATWQTKPVYSNIYDGTNPVFFDTTPDLAVDTFGRLPGGSKNPRFGQLYAVWMRQYPPGNFPGDSNSTGGTDLMIASSSDSGQTWSTPAVIPSLEFGDTPAGVGFLRQPHIVIGPQGDVYVASYFAQDFFVQRSTDGGRKFTTPNDGGFVFSGGFSAGVNPAGLPSNHFRTLTVRDIAADPTRPGTLYATEAIPIRGGDGNPLDAADIFFARSTDFGKTWRTFSKGATPTPLNDDNGGQSASGLADDVVTGQALPRLAIDDKGHVAVIWYDTRRDTSNHLLDVVGTVSADRGLHFSPNFRLTSESFDADRGAFIDPSGKTDYYLGDSVGLAIAGGSAYATWTDTRAGNQDIAFSSFAISPPPVPAGNDRFEPNDTAVTAAPLGTILSQSVPKLAAAPGNDDWFRFTTASTAALSITATPASVSHLALQIELWDSTGTTRLASGRNQINYADARSGQQYLLRVVSAGVTKGNYGLSIQSLAADLGPTVTADQSATLQAGDQTFYALTAAASGELVVDLANTGGAGGSLELDVLGSPGPLVLNDLSNLASASIAAGVSGTLKVPVAQGQQIVVRVSNASAAARNFTLSVINFDQFSPASTSAAHLFPAGAGPSVVADADLNGDGITDLVVSDGLSNTISVLLGNGDGSFQAPRQFAIGAYKSPNPVATNAGLPNFHRQVVIADFDADGIPDIAVTNFDSSDISVLIGRGDGTFAPQRRFSVGGNPIGLAAADLNGDGRIDLAAIDSPNGGDDSRITVLLNIGHGYFGPLDPSRDPFLANIGVNYPYSTIAVADINGDHIPDLIVSGGNAAQFSSFLGNGDGTFGFRGNFNAGGLSGGLIVRDVNGDGIPDVLTDDQFLNVAVLTLGNGDGTFQPPQRFESGFGPLDMVLADVGSPITLPDGSPALGPPDGRPDLVLALGATAGVDSVVLGPHGISVLAGLADAAGHFTGFGPPVLLTPGNHPQSLVVGNLAGGAAAESDVAFVDTDGVHVVLPQAHSPTPNLTPQTARDLGTVLHVLEPTLTIAPGADDAYFRLTAPIEGSIHASGDEVLDFSGSFRDTTGPGLSMQILDAAAGDVLAEGEHAQVTVPQGTRLLVHVFGLTAADGSRGAGAYTLDIDVLPQLVSVESQPLLPDAGNQGPSASLVLTFQGDRLDAASAQDPANYLVTTAGGQDIPVAGALYDPGSNVDVATGVTYPTAVRQTVTLTFDQLLPVGSYQITVKPAVIADPYNQDEQALLAASMITHSVVSITGPGQVVPGGSLTAPNLVSASAGGAVAAWAAGTRFFTQLHDDLGALLDSLLTSQGDAPAVTAALQKEIQARLVPTVAGAGGAVLVIWLDTVGARLYPTGASAAGIDYDLGSNQLTGSLPATSVSVASNLELLVTPLSAAEPLTLALSDVHDTARGGALIFNGSTAAQTMSLTEPIRAGQREFQFGQQQSAPLEPLVFLLAGPLSLDTSTLPMRDTMEAAEPLAAAGPVSLPPVIGPIEHHRIDAIPRPPDWFDSLLQALRRALASWPLRGGAANAIDQFLVPLAAGHEPALESDEPNPDSGDDVNDPPPPQAPTLIQSESQPEMNSIDETDGSRLILAGLFSARPFTPGQRRRRRRGRSTRGAHHP
jgi:hypothetical protein